MTVFAALLSITVHAEDFTLTSYYPAPFGAYDQLRLGSDLSLSDPCGIGSIAVENTDKLLRFCYDNGSGAGYWDLLSGDRVGDLDLDGAITLTDADIIDRLIAGRTIIDFYGNVIPANTPQGDVNNSGNVTAADAVVLRDYLTGIALSAPGNKIGWFYADPNPLPPATALTVMGNMVVSGNMGIGTTTSPSNTLDVAGGVSIVSLANWGTTAPANGLYVTGNVGIGTSVAGAALTVNGAVLRSGSTLWGTNSNTHTNLGYGSVTGTSGQNYSYAAVGGGNNNIASQNYAAVAGGEVNTASGQYSTIGGGNTNLASANYATIAGGSENSNQGTDGTIGGGYQVKIVGNGSYSSIGGGNNNKITLATYASILGGLGNSIGAVGAIYGVYSVIPGGENNTVLGDYSWAGGRNMALTATADQTFAWGHDPNPVSISAANAFVVYSGNVGIGTISPGTKLSIAGLTSSGSGSYVRILNGDVYFDSSSARYKKDVKPLEEDFEKIMGLEQKSFVDKASGQREIGYLAEDFDKAGLKDLVLYHDGRAEGIHYEKIIVYLLELIKGQENEIQQLEDKTYSLEKPQRRPTGTSLQWD